jgi:ABC-type transport system involved in multi-copper enzyme maturation permease subunit
MNAVITEELSPPISRSSPPVRAMARVTWLQHRSMILGALGLFGALAVYILINSNAVHSIYAQYVLNGCSTPVAANVVTCSGLISRIQTSTDTLTLVHIAVLVVPVVIGMFIGAPLIAREFESGTYRFTWTQGMPRTLWLTLKIAFLALAVIVPACLLGLLAGGYNNPFNAIGLASRWQIAEFDMTGLTLPAWTLLGLAFGAFAGALVKRTVSAMAITGAVIGGCVVAVFWKLDYLLLSLGTRVTTISPEGLSYGALNMSAQTYGTGYGRYGANISTQPVGSWLVSGWYTAPNGSRLSSHAMHQLIITAVDNSKRQIVWLAQHHYAYWVSYQPANRYWMFQSIEAVALIGLSLVLAWGTSILIRRRA